MKKMRKSFSLIAVLVCAVLCTQISAYAAEAEPDVSAISNAEIVSVSEESTTYIVNEEIAVIETVREVEYVPVVQRASTASWTYKDYTRSKYLYIIDTVEKVANYSLTATCRYDGASLAECRGTQTDNESLNSSWKVTGIATVDNPSDYLGGAVGNFTLYKKGLLGNWSENNSDEIRIWCDHKGVISTN